VPAFVGIGLVPDSGISHTLTRLIGPGRAFEWMTSGRRLGAEEAEGWGLVSSVVEPGELPQTAAELAASLAVMPTRAIALTKELFERAPLSTLQQQLELEAQLQSAAAATADFTEGVRAFLEKRPPRFQGR
jgi:2-(1,2-epoxy-1,2-dihydrophenyl)acetyl-CoA isomerase